MRQLTHLDGNGNAWMVDVGGKEETERVAIATGKIQMVREAFEAAVQGGNKKGDVLGVARISGIMAAKRTAELIPLCHPLLTDSCTVDFEQDDARYILKVICKVTTTGKTGVEMEALTGVSVALLTVYDMCKAISKGMEIGHIQLEHKSGGKSGDYSAEGGGAR